MKKRTSKMKKIFAIAFQLGIWTVVGAAFYYAWQKPALVQNYFQGLNYRKLMPATLLKRSFLFH